MTPSWPVRRLGEILKLEYGRPLDVADRKLDGAYPVYGANGEKTRTDRFYFDRPSIIVGRKGSAGELNLTEPRFWPLDVTYFVTFEAQEHDLRFLYYLLATFDLPKLAKGIKPGLNREDVYSLTARIPPLADQQRIVAVLDEVLSNVRLARANTEQNLRYARGLLENRIHDVFADVWTASDRVALEELTSDIADGDHQAPPKSSSGVPFITISNIVKETREIDFADTFMVPREYFESIKPRRRPMTGDILYTVTGSFGIPVIVNEVTEFCFQRHIALIRPKPGIDTTWLYYLLLSPQVFDQAEAGATGTAQRTVSLKVLRRLEVPVVPQETQRAVADHLDAFTLETRRLADAYRRKLALFEEFRTSVLHRAVQGAT